MDHPSSINTLETTASLASTLTNTNSHQERDMKKNEKTFDTIDLQQLSISSTEHPVEQADWIEVNEQLRKRGLNPIILKHPSSNLSSEGCNVLGEETSLLLRKTLLHLLQENDQKQAIIDQSSKFKGQSNSTASSPIKHSKESQHVDESSRTKWNVSMPTFDKMKKDNNDYRVSMEVEYGKKIEVLQKEIDEMKDSLEDFRKTKQFTIVSATNKDTERSTHSHDATKSQPHTGRSHESHETNPSLVHCFQSEPSIVKKYKKKCAALKSKIHLLKIENSQLHLRIQSMETLSQERRADISRNRSSGKKSSPKAQQQDMRKQFDGYRRKLQHIYNIVGESNHEECASKLHAMKNQNDYCRELEKLLQKINEVVGGERQKNSMEILDSRIELLTSLMFWKADRAEVEDLYKTAKNLSLLLIPWKDVEDSQVNGGATVQNVNKLLQKLSNAVYRGPNEKAESDLTEEQLKTSVLHFMRLFDVRTSSAVYTRMYDVYVKYFEMVNVFNSMREILHLRKDCTLHYLVNVVGRLSKARHLLHVKKLDSVIKQIEDYDRFYGAFYKLATDLMEILGVDQLDEILPVVKAFVNSSST